MRRLLPENIEWVWFDLDDTLYDFSTSSLQALKGLYDEFSLDAVFGSVERWIDIYHRHNHDLWDKYNRGVTDQSTLRRERFVRPMVEAGIDLKQALSLWQEMDRSYLDRLSATGLTIDEAVETLTDLRRLGYKIGVLTNGFVGVQERKLATSGLAPLVDCLVLSDEAGYNKPDRRLFDYALRKSGASAAASVMVGDNADTDIAGALGAGWQAILFSRTDTSAAEEKSAQYNINVIFHLSDLINM